MTQKSLIIAVAIVLASGFLFAIYLGQRSKLNQLALQKTSDKAISASPSPVASAGAGGSPTASAAMSESEVKAEAGLNQPLSKSNDFATLEKETSETKILDEDFSNL